MTSTATDRRSLVTCRAGGERFALDVARVERVLRYTAPRTLPNSAPWLRGVINVGDQLVPVLDLRERLGLAAAVPEASSRILVLVVEQGRIGFVVDAVDEVLGVDPQAIEATPEVYRGLARAFVAGVLRREQDVFIVLEPNQLVTSQERLTLTAAVEDLFFGR